MVFKDDEDDFISPSSSRSFESPNAAKKERKEQRAKQKGLLSALKRALPRNQLPEKTTREINNEELIMKNEELEKEDNRNNNLGTKTHKQMEEENVIQADETPTTDGLVEKSHKESIRKEDLSKETASEDA